MQILASQDAILEMSKRIDNNEDESRHLRERAHKLENTQSTIEAALGKIDSNLLAIYESQTNLSLRIREAEKVTNPIMFVKHHWKILVLPLVISFCIGIILEKNSKEFFMELMPDKLVKALKVISNG